MPRAPAKGSSHVGHARRRHGRRVLVRRLLRRGGRSADHRARRRLHAGWPSSLGGAAAGFAALALLIAVFGPLLGYAPLQALQFVVGVLLLLFGLRWLRKAILREIGVIAKHDEEAAFAKETRALDAGPQRGANGLDWIAATASFKAVLLEGTEVVFIVLAVGAGRGMLAPAIAGPSPPASPSSSSARRFAVPCRGFPRTRSNSRWA